RASAIRFRSERAEELEQTPRDDDDLGAGAEDGRNAGALELRMVFRRDDASANDLHFAGASRAQRLNELRQEHAVTARLRGNPDEVRVVLDGLPRDFLGRRKKRTHVDVEAEIREGRSDHLLATIVAVLTELRDEDARPSAVGFAEAANRFGELRPLCVALEIASVD